MEQFSVKKTEEMWRAVQGTVNSELLKLKDEGFRAHDAGIIVVVILTGVLAHYAKIRAKMNSLTREEIVEEILSTLNGALDEMEKEDD